MRVAVYGGSFNPLHVGHLMVCAWLRWTDHADEVWLLPSYAHPFKDGEKAVSFEVRAEWCARAVTPLAGVEVCDIEAELPVPSYTIDTLTALAERHPAHRFRFVLGADLAEEVSRWRQWPEVERRFDPIWVGRQGHPAPPGGVAFPDISSTDVRRRAAAGEGIQHLVPASIVHEVAGAYGPAGRGGSPSGS